MCRALWFLFFAASLTFGQGIYRSSSQLSYRRILSGDAVPNTFASISPDGDRLAFVRGGNVFAEGLTGGTPRQLTSWQGADGASYKAIWSPDGRSVAVSAAKRSSIAVVEVNGRPARTVYKVTSGAVFPGGWSADQKRLLVWTQSGDNQQLAWLAIGDSSLTPIATRATPELNLAISPGGRFIAYYGKLDKTSKQLFVMTSDGFEERAATNALPKGELLGWLPDGQHLLVLQGATLYAVPTADGHITGAPTMLNRNLGTGLHGAPTVTPLGIDRKGTLFYSLQKATSDIYIADLNPVSGRVVSDPFPLQLARPGDNVLPRWSPDGKKILYHWVQWAPAGNVVYELASDREEHVAPGVPSAAICWADGGAAILAIPYVGGPSPYQGLVKINLASGSSTLLAPSSDAMVPLNCAGDWVTLATTDALRVYNVAERKESLLYRYSVPTNTRPSLSHDGRFVATVTQVSPNETALLVLPTAGGEARELVRLARPVEFQQIFFGYTWSPDDRYLYFLKRPRAEAPYELFRIPSTGGSEESLSLQFPELRDIDISPDGKKIAFSVGNPLLREIWAVENVLLATPR